MSLVLMPKNVRDGFNLDNSTIVHAINMSDYLCLSVEDWYFNDRSFPDTNVQKFLLNLFGAAFPPYLRPDGCGGFDWLPRQDAPIDGLQVR